MNHFNYQEDFKKLYDIALKAYQGGNTDQSSYFNDAEKELIKSNGWRIQDFFDYAEDFNYDQVPSYEIAQSIEQVRREYLFHEQDGKLSDNRIYSKDLPAKSDTLANIVWLPRIIQKAKSKLLGELADEIMYCCGGDRKFLSTHNIHPAEFLRIVWKYWNNEEHIIAFVQQRSDIA